jgi:hypothetical protein
MSYPWIAYKTWVTGEVLTAGDLNFSFSTTITNSDPSSINDYSVNVATMRSTADPYPASAESLATTLSGELERLRYVINQLNGTAQWYIDPSSSIETIVNGTQIFAGAKTFSSSVTLTGGASAAAAITITPTTNQLVLGTTRTVTLTAPTPASSSRTVTFPDLSSDYSVVGTAGAQTIAGVKTFTSTLTMSGAGIAMGSQKITGLAAATTSGDALRYEQLIGVYALDSAVVHNTGAETVAGAKSFTSNLIKQNGSVDDTTFTALDIQGGDSSSRVAMRSFTTTAITTAKKIYDLSQFGVLLIVNLSNGTDIATDLIWGGFGKTPVVISAFTGAGAPAVRTYSEASGALKVAMASGTYTANVVAFEMRAR